jgi:hypothetical protein
MNKQFEVGKTYSTTSIGDSECWFSITVISRTAKTIRVKVQGQEKTLRISPSYQDGHESVKPFGTYSMCCIIDASDEGRGPKKV